MKNSYYRNTKKKTLSEDETKGTTLEDFKN